MDVFKTHVGEGRAIAISRENYFMETKGMEPSRTGCRSSTPIWKTRQA